MSLEEIARRAGVGIGTLYRHFPTRDAVVEAVYRREVQQLAEAAPRLAASMPPEKALRAWMLLFVDYIAAKRVIAPALTALAAGAPELRTPAGTIESIVRFARLGDLAWWGDSEACPRALCLWA